MWSPIPISPRQGHTDSVVDAASSAGVWCEGERLQRRLLCTLRQQRFSHGLPTLEVAFSTDGVYAATGSYDGTVRRTKVQGGRAVSAES